MRYLILILSVLFISSPLQARPIDTQQISKKEGTSSSIAGSYERKTGNEDGTKVDSSIYLQHLRGKGLTLGVAEKKWERDTVDREMYHLLQRYSAYPKWDVEAFGHFERDRARGIRSKTSFGLGPYNKMIDTDFMNMGLGYSYVLEKEEYVVDPTEYSKRYYMLIDFGIKLGEVVRVAEIVQSEVKTDDQKDNRLFTKTILKIQQPESQFGISLQVDTALDTRPPTDTDSEDTETKISFFANF